MSEYVKRETMVERFKTMILWCEDNLDAEGLKDFRRGCIATLKDELNYLQKVVPTADVVERKRGKWEQHRRKWQCSCCGILMDIDGTPEENLLHFCPNCGADMRKKEDV